MDFLKQQLEKGITAILNAPWEFKAVVLFTAGSWVWHWFSKRRQSRFMHYAEQWPAVTGKVVAREIKEKHHKHDITAFVAVVSYSYFKDGYQSGRFIKRFDSHDEAGDWLDLLYEQEVPVHVDPMRPNRSALLDRELPQEVINGVDALDPYESSGFQNDSNEQWNNVLAWAAVAGLFVEAILHFGQLLGRGVGKDYAFGVTMAMQLFAIGISIAASMKSHLNNERITSKRYREALDAVTPIDRKVLGKIIWVYGIGRFAWTWVRGFFFHVDEGVEGALVMFTAFQAIFLFEAYRMTQFQRWKRESRLR